MTTATMPTLPSTAYTKADLDAGLDKITQDKRRRTRAHALFNTQVNEQGVAQRKAIKNALRQAATGMKDERSKLKEARVAARITLSQQTHAHVNNGLQHTKKIAAKRPKRKLKAASKNRKTTKTKGLEFRKYPRVHPSVRGVVGSLVGFIVAVLFAALATPWVAMQFSTSLNELVTLMLTVLFIISCVTLGATLGWSIGVGRFTTDHQVPPSKKSKKTTTTRS